MTPETPDLFGSGHLSDGVISHARCSGRACPASAMPALRLRGIIGIILGVILAIWLAGMAAGGIFAGLETFLLPG